MALEMVELAAEDYFHNCLRSFDVPCSFRRTQPGRELTASYWGLHGILAYLTISSALRGPPGQEALVLAMENKEFLLLRHFPRGMPDELRSAFNALQYRRVRLYHAELAEDYINDQTERARAVNRQPPCLRLHPEVRILQFLDQMSVSFYCIVDPCTEECSSFRPFHVQLYNPYGASSSLGPSGSTDRSTSV